MKTLIALTIALLALMPRSAYALRITEGHVATAHGGSPWATFRGDNFSVWGGQESYKDLRPAFGLDPYTWTLIFAAPSVVTVGGEECRATVGEPCGQITLTSPGLAMPDDWPQTTVFTAMVPFSATGFLLVGGNRYDINGEGWMTGQRCLDFEECGIVPVGLPVNPDIRVEALLTYRFTVGEPPTSLLTAAFALTVLGMVFVHRRVIT